MKKSKILKMLMATIIASIACLALVACSSSNATSTDSSSSSNSSTSENVGDNSGFVLSESDITLSLIGQQETLVATFNNQEVEASFVVDDRTIVTIEEGTITALSNGSATVTATYNEEELTCLITVDAQLAVLLDYESDLAQLQLNESLALNPTIQFEQLGDTDGTFSTSSTDEAVATVSQDGTINAVGKGVAVVTITSTLTASTYTWGADGVGYYDLPATANIVVIVGNEFDSQTNEELIGSYRGSVEWSGTATSTSADFGLIVAEIVVTIFEDGTFFHNIANGKRAAYDAQASTSTHPYNAQLQESSVLGSTYLDIVQSSMTHISQKGYVAVIDGELLLVLISASGTTEVLNYGTAENNEWATSFTAISDMVAIHSDMTASLVKDPTFKDVAGSYSYTGTNDSMTTALLNEDGTFTFTYNGEMVASGDFYIVGSTVYLPYNTEADGEGEMALLWNEAGSLYGKVVIGYGFGFTWTLKTADYQAPSTDDSTSGNTDSELSSEALALVGVYNATETYGTTTISTYTLSLFEDGTFKLERSDSSYMVGTWTYANGNITLTPTDTVKTSGDSSGLYLDSTFVLAVSVNADGETTFAVTAGYVIDSVSYGLPAIFSMGMSVSTYFPIYNFTFASEIE